MDNIDDVKKQLRFATAMRFKLIDLLKEWQHYAIEKLNDYCKNNIDDIEYLSFIRAYNKVLLTFEHWVAESSLLSTTLKELQQYAKLNDTNSQD